MNRAAMLPMLVISCENKPDIWNMASASTTFRKGDVNNPKGRPAAIRDLKLACQEMVPEIIVALKAALQAPSERVQASGLILAYGFGKPVARIDHRVIRSISDLHDEELLAVMASADDEAGESLH